MISLGLPNDPSEVAAIGKVAIRHGQLDHGLKLTIRSIRGLSVEQALAETKRKSVHQLQALVEEHARDRFGEAPMLVRIRELLHLSRRAADYRNSVLNDFWAAESDAAPIHAPEGRPVALPRVAELEAVADNLFSVVKELDHERHHGCLHEPTEAFTALGDKCIGQSAIETAAITASTNACAIYTR
jgi:hypothetical protein